MKTNPTGALRVGSVKERGKDYVTEPARKLKLARHRRSRYILNNSLIGDRP